MTQNEMILNHLKRNRSITQLEALNRFGVMRLASRIDELRQIGMNIETELVSVETKRGVAKIAKYRLRK